MPFFNGLGLHLGNLSHLSSAKTRSISPENFTGKKGGGALATEGTGAHAARDMGKGWKISPSVVIKSGETFTIADIEGPGAIQQIWMTPTGNWRFSILRIYWDGSDIPSVECPLGDFFLNLAGDLGALDGRVAQRGQLFAQETDATVVQLHRGIPRFGRVLEVAGNAGR